LLGFVALAVLALGADGFWIEPSSLTLDRYDVSLGDARLKGLKIAVISDLHGGAPFIDTAKIDQVVALTNAAKPDLILLAGDFAGHVHLVSHPLPIETIAAHLKPLSAPLGVYAVLGNHDHKVEGAGWVTHALEDNGIAVLSNRHLAIAQRGFFLVGIDDADSRHADPQAALAGLPAGAPALCFTHSPDIFPFLPHTCVLTIAGHTHGGQVDLPLLGRLIVPSHYGRRYAAGLIREDGKTLFVSTGIGTSVIPVRFGVPPEISFLTLR
jgi:predicted MPP superfamily phosphohydrolase